MGNMVSNYKKLGGIMTCPHCGTYCMNNSIFCNPPLIEEQTMENDRREAIRNIQHYWDEWRDIEAWIGWERQKENFSKVNFALSQVKIWEDMVDKAVSELGDPDICVCDQEPCICY